MKAASSRQNHTATATQAAQMAPALRVFFQSRSMNVVRCMARSHSAVTGGAESVNWQGRRYPPAMKPVAIVAADAPPRAKSTSYPEPFASRMNGREKRPLGDLFGI